MLCLELLVEVLSAEPCAILQDLVHLVSKSNMLRARNDLVDNVCISLKDKCKKIKESRQLISTIEEVELINIYRRVPFES